MAWGLPPTLKGFFPGDDAQDPDIYMLIALGVGPTTDLLWNNSAGTVGPVTPTNYVAKIVNLFVANRAASSQVVTISAINATSSSYAVAEVAVPAVGSFNSSDIQFRANAPPGTKFQAASATTSFGGIDIVAAVRYVKAAGM